MTGTQSDDAKQKMTGIRTALRREVEKIRANPNYTDRGRAREMAMAVLNHRKQAQHLRDNFSSNNNTVRVELTARLFGVPAGADADAATMLVHRDAEDRATKLVNANDAKAMLTRALEHGDTLLARAVAGHAYGKKWHEIAETYAEAKGLSGTLDELTSIPSGRLTRLGEAALFAIPAPQELDTHLGGQSDAVLRNFLNEKN